MKSLLASIVASLLIVLAVIAAGDAYGTEVTVIKALVATYWLTIPTILVGICIAIFGEERQ